MYAVAVHVFSNGSKHISQETHTPSWFVGGDKNESVGVFFLIHIMYAGRFFSRYFIDK
jgi:hypothetical protein